MGYVYELAGYEPVAVWVNHIGAAASILPMPTHQLSLRQWVAVLMPPTTLRPVWEKE